MGLGISGVRAPGGRLVEIAEGCRFILSSYSLKTPSEVQSNRGDTRRLGDTSAPDGDEKCMDRAQWAIMWSIMSWG
jgi:hypothetical protein